jgi:CBS domain-containing protein
MRVKDVMTPKVISVGVDETVVNAARLMLQHQISGLPVVDKKASSLVSLARAIFCGAVSLARGVVVRNGSNFSLGQASSPRNTFMPRAKKLKMS